MRSVVRTDIDATSRPMPPTMVIVPDACASPSRNFSTESLWYDGKKSSTKEATISNGLSMRSTRPAMPVASTSMGTSETNTLNANACAHRNTSFVVNSWKRPRA